MSATYEEVGEYLSEAWELAVEHLQNKVGEEDFDVDTFEYALEKFFDYGYQATTFSDED